MKTRIAGWLRQLAGRLDPENQPRKTSYSYTVEQGPKWPQGVAIHLNGRGAPLYVLSDAEWKLAYTQADTDWRTPQDKIHDVFQQFGAAIEEAVLPKKAPRRKGGS